MCELTDAPECQKRAEAQNGRRMCLEQRIAQQNMALIMLEDHFLFQQHAAHAINGCKNLLVTELTDIFVSVRAEMIAIILVYAQIELSTVLNDRNVQSTQQHMVLIIQLWHRDYQQAMIFSSIAVYNCRT